MRDGEDLRRLRRRAKDAVAVLLARDPDLLETLIAVAEVKISTELSTAAAESIGESYIDA